MSPTPMPSSRVEGLRRRALAVVGLWVFGALVAVPLTGRAAGQVVTTPTTEGPVTTGPVTQPPTSAAPATTTPVTRTVPRRPSTSLGTSTSPPSTTPTTVAGTLPPTTAGPAPAPSTTTVEDTRPGEGKMPAWPMVLSGVGLAGVAGILGRQWASTRGR